MSCKIRQFMCLFIAMHIDICSSCCCHATISPDESGVRLAKSSNISDFLFFGSQFWNLAKLSALPAMQKRIFPAKIMRRRRQHWKERIPVDKEPILVLLCGFTQCLKHNLNSKFYAITDTGYIFKKLTKKTPSIKLDQWGNVNIKSITY